MIHSKLSPSDSERWIDCAAAISMDSHFPDSESFEAREGTAAHELAAIEASYAFGYINELQLFDKRDAWRLANTEFNQKEISIYVDRYVEHLVERFAEAKIVLIESKVSTPLEDVWGTADCIAIYEDHVEVVDLKYGSGVHVEAFNNPQIRIYGIGVLELCTGLAVAGLIEDVPETVRLSIYQPRRGNFGTEELSASDLYAWFNAVVVPAVERVYLLDPPFGPSARACRWCPASGQCTAQKDKILSQSFTDPGLMSPKDIGDALKMVAEIKSWLADIEKVALQKAYRDGIEIPGWKVVRSNGRRYIENHEAAIEALFATGLYTEAQVSVTKARGIGELEKLVGAKELSEILGDLLVRGKGTESLVPADDRRPAIDRNTDAAKVFGEVEDDGS